MRVREVPEGDLRSISGEEWVVRERGIYLREGIAYVPARDDDPEGKELPPRTLYRGRGFHMIGTIAVVHGKEPAPREVQEIECWKHPTGILHVRACRGRERVPEVRVLRGRSSDVCHREQGISYWLDPAKVMFAQGNRKEKERLIHEVRPGERVADMFAGIGYFSIPAALAGARVHAMEINPVAYHYLEKNIAENHLEGRVEAGCGDCRDLLSGEYDRILMGHFDAPLMIDHAFGHIREGGTIHLHAAGPLPPAIPDRFRDACRDAGTVRRIKKVAPHKWHYVLDMRVI